MACLSTHIVPVERSLLLLFYVIVSHFSGCHFLFLFLFLRLVAWKHLLLVSFFPYAPARLGGTTKGRLEVPGAGWEPLEQPSLVPPRLEGEEQAGRLLLFSHVDGRCLRGWLRGVLSGGGYTDACPLVCLHACCRRESSNFFPPVNAVKWRGCSFESLG